MVGLMKWVTLASACVLLATGGVCDEVPVGLIVSNWKEYNSVFPAINFALAEQHANNGSGRGPQLKLWADRIKTVDAFKLSKIICDQVQNP